MARASLVRIHLACLAVALALSTFGCSSRGTSGSASTGGESTDAGLDGSPANSVVPTAEYFHDGRVVLGSPRLTAGIPGSGPLKLDEIRRWLADPENLAPLDFVLPLGLRAGADRIAIPPDNPLTRAKIELGRQLFFDRRLAKTGRFSCGDCHHPRDHFAHPGHGRDLTVAFARTVPPVFNRILSTRQFWDGRAASLEDQALAPIEATKEMANTLADCVATLNAIDGYRVQFETIFGGVTAPAVGRALASFERAIVTGPSAVDYASTIERLEGRSGEQLTAAELEELAQATAGAASNPLSAAARRGGDLFGSDRARCTACHGGPNLTDEGFHRLGVGFDEPTADLGRYRVTGDANDRGAFKTPTLRNVAQTPPYMHRGQLPDLEGVVEWYARGGNGDGEIKPLDLSAQEKSDLAEFLRACTGELPTIETGRLPR